MATRWKKGEEAPKDVYHTVIGLTSETPDDYPKRIWITHLGIYDNHNRLWLKDIWNDDNHKSIELTKA